MSNPLEKELLAIAIKYVEDEDPAPKVIAKGRGEIAEVIIAEAAKHHIAVQAHPQLAHMVEGVELNHYIPFEAYYLAAKILGDLNK